MSKQAEAIDELIAVMETLLSPEGCPWDREQTHDALIRYLIEESYEVIETIAERDMNKLREELGDLLLQIVFHAALAQREGFFDFGDVAKTVSQKMVSRHPHVFGSMQLETSDDVMAVWESFKKKEGKKNLLEGIPKFLPALMRAEKIQEKASQIGFDWPSAEGALAKLHEEVDELLEAETELDIAEEMGDVFFALVNVARFKQVEPEQALQYSNDKFTRRFEYIEAQAKASGREIGSMNLEEMDQLWDEAKAKGL
jgi:tetrapyrrole methylase family protein/MazG family protein